MSKIVVRQRMPRAGDESTTDLYQCLSGLRAGLARGTHRVDPLWTTIPIINDCEATDISLDTL